MGSFKQLCTTLKLKIADGDKAGEGHKEIAKRFQAPISFVWNVNGKWQFTGTVDRLKQDLEDLRQSLTKQLAGLSEKQVKTLQKDLIDSGVVLHCSIVKKYLYKCGPRGRVIRRKPLLCRHHKILHLKFANEHINKPDAFKVQAEVKMELLGRNKAKGTEFNEKKLCPTVKHQSCFGVALQPVAQETFHEKKEREKFNKFRTPT